MSILNCADGNVIDHCAGHRSTIASITVALMTSSGNALGGSPTWQLRGNLGDGRQRIAHVDVLRSHPVFNGIDALNQQAPRLRQYQSATLQ